jgi:gluconate 2-dehydrogenase subunit 3-like protein
MSDREVSRRSALKYLGLLGASAAGREFLTAWLPSPGVRAERPDKLTTIHGMNHSRGDEKGSAPYKPKFFNAGQFKTVEILTEMIIPTDDQPGAKEAQVANYIDFVVFSAREFQPSLQQEWLTGLAFLDRESHQRFAKAFRLASEADRTQLLTDMSAPERDSKVQHEGYGFFALVKDMTVEGFYTSRVGLIDVLDYQGMNYMSEFPGCTHPEHQG